MWNAHESSLMHEMTDKLFIAMRFSAQTWLILFIYTYVIETYSW